MGELYGRCFSLYWARVRRCHVSKFRLPILALTLYLLEQVFFFT